MGVNSDENDRYTELYNANVNAVYKTALHYSGNQHTAEEIVQEVFYKLYINRKNINIDAVNSWLLTTAKRMALNYKRDFSREVPAEEIYDDTENGMCTESPEEEFIVNLYHSECQELLDRILDELYRVNTRWYDAITITYLLEKPQKEVAESMEVSLEVLHSMLYRAKKWIQKNYKEEYERLKRL